MLIWICINLTLILFLYVLNVRLSVQSNFQTQNNCQWVNSRAIVNGISAPRRSSILDASTSCGKCERILNSSRKWAMAMESVRWNFLIVVPSFYSSCLLCARTRGTWRTEEFEISPIYEAQIYEEINLVLRPDWQYKTLLPNDDSINLTRVIFLIWRN